MTDSPALPSLRPIPDAVTTDDEFQRLAQYIVNAIKPRIERNEADSKGPAAAAYAEYKLLRQAGADELAELRDQLSAALRVLDTYAAEEQRKCDADHAALARFDPSLPAFVWKPPKVKGFRMRRRWHVEIVDNTALPPEYLTTVPDSAKIRRRVEEDPAAAQQELGHAVRIWYEVTQ